MCFITKDMYPWIHGSAAGAAAGTAAGAAVSGATVCTVDTLSCRYRGGEAPPL